MKKIKIPEEEKTVFKKCPFCRKNGWSISKQKCRICKREIRPNAIFLNSNRR
jgi:hypothetical protein